MCPSKSTPNPDSYEVVFKNCDFDFVKKELISTLAGGVIPNELAALLDAFTDLPCRETAIPLIDYNPDLAVMFRDSADARRFVEKLNKKA